MRTELTKKQKTTVIYFDEHRRMIEVQTHNTDLKKRLTAFAAKYPQCCRQTDDDEQGGLTFEIEKGRLSFKHQLKHIRCHSTYPKMKLRQESMVHHSDLLQPLRGFSLGSALKWTRSPQIP